MSDPKQIELRDKIMDEIFYALGMGRTSRGRALLRPVFSLAASRFARVAARFDARVPEEGIPGGARQLLADLNVQVTARGAANIPTEGPLLVVCNHPGAYDSVAVAARIPRPDLRLMVSDIPFLRAVPESARRFIFVPAESGGRTTALRTAVQHLQAGGAVMLFPHGDVEPDPGFMQGAWVALGEWSASVEIMLRKVPETWLQVALASDVLLSKFVRSPLARLRQAPARRQKLAEFLQVIQQLVFPGSIPTDVHISFARPVCARDIEGDRIMPAVVDLARGLLAEHLAAFHPGAGEL